MTVVTTRPNATTANTGALTGGATLHGVLSDNSDSSYVVLNALEYCSFSSAAPSIPSGGIVKSIALRLRGKVASSSASVKARVNPGGISGIPYAYGSVFWPTAVTWNMATHSTTSTPTAPFGYFESASAGNPDLYLYEAYFDTVYVAKPTLTVDAPTGTITTTNRPTASWTGTFDSDGSTQISYRVKVFNSTQYGAGGFDPASSTPVWDSGEVVSTDTSVVVGANLPNATYRAYVQLGALVDFSTGIKSDWTYGGFVENVDLPAVPTLTLTTDATNARIRVQGSGNSGTATTSGIEAQRQDPYTSEWIDVRDGSQSGTSLDVYDYEAPLGQAISYRIRAYHDYSGEYAYSAWSSTSSATITDPFGWWLKAPEDSTLNVKVTPESFSTIEKQARQGTFQAIGATKAVTISDTRSAEAGSFSFYADDDAALEDIEALLDSGYTILWQPRYVDHEPPRFISVGDYSIERGVDRASSSFRKITATWTEVEAPS